MSDKIVTIGDRESLVSLTKEHGVFRVVRGEAADTIEVLNVTENEIEVVINGKRRIVPFLVEGERLRFQYEGEVYLAEVAAGSQKKKGRHKEHSMSAPMPGVVLKIFVAPGEEVAKGKPLLILEAMKMEHQITAPYDGVVRTIACKEGELVQPGIDLIELEKRES